MFEICPLLNSSIEAVLATGNENSRALAAQNRDCFKQQLLETLRDFVILLQLVKNGKPVPDPSALDVSCTPVNGECCTTVMTEITEIRVVNNPVSFICNLVHFVDKKRIYRL